LQTQWPRRLLASPPARATAGEAAQQQTAQQQPPALCFNQPSSHHLEQEKQARTCDKGCRQQASSGQERESNTTPCMTDLLLPTVLVAPCLLGTVLSRARVLCVRPLPAHSTRAWSVQTRCLCQTAQSATLHACRYADAHTLLQGPATKAPGGGRCRRQQFLLFTRGCSDAQQRQPSSSSSSGCIVSGCCEEVTPVCV
jgi:hypothetical protein